jgi:hypothetical protein
LTTGLTTCFDKLTTGLDSSSELSDSSELDSFSIFLIKTGCVLIMGLVICTGFVSSSLSDSSEDDDSAFLSTGLADVCVPLTGFGAS